MSKQVRQKGTNNYFIRFKSEGDLEAMMRQESLYSKIKRFEGTPSDPLTKWISFKQFRTCSAVQKSFEKYASEIQMDLRDHRLEKRASMISCPITYNLHFLNLTRNQYTVVNFNS